MSNEHIGDFHYRDFFKEAYPDGEEGAKEALEDAKRLLRYIAKYSPESADRILNDVYIIASGDAHIQLQLLNTFFLMASPIIVENGEERHMNHDEMEISSPLRNMAMNAIALAFELSAKRIRGMQTTIYKLKKALSDSMKDDIDEQSNT